MKDLVEPLISCDQLIFKINEFLLESEERLQSKALPLEIIRRMGDVWKAESIVIEYDFWPESMAMRVEWADDGLFTPLRFDEFYQGTDSGSDKKKFSSVTIDMRNTRNMYAEVIDGSIGRNDSYSNLIANVRRVFPTDKISIIGQLLPNPTSRLHSSLECFENILHRKDIQNH